jgi:hypothetical protein
MEWTRRKAGSLLLASALIAGATPAWTASTVYRCPGPPILYTDALSAAEAQQRNCRTIEGAPITVMRSAPAAAKPAPVLSSAPRPAEQRIDPADQRARDSDARRILEAELQREQERMAELQKEYNNGEPERRGDERNYEKYIERTAGLKAAITRKEADLAAIRRELAKLPQ